MPNPDNDVTGKTIEQYINIDVKILNKILGNQIHSIFNTDYTPSSYFQGLHTDLSGAKRKGGGFSWTKVKTLRGSHSCHPFQLVPSLVPFLCHAFIKMKRKHPMEPI